MSMKVKELISTNRNPCVSWKIGGEIYTNSFFIPERTLERNVVNWIINLWDGIIEIVTDIDNDIKNNF